MNAKLSSVENLVSEVLKRTNGACASEASAVVEAAVHKARAKGKMLPHLDSDLVLSALDVSMYFLPGCCIYTAFYGHNEVANNNC